MIKSFLTILLLCSIYITYAQIATISTFAKTIVDTTSHKLYSLKRLKKYDDYQFIKLNITERTKIVKSLSKNIKDSTSYFFCNLNHTNSIISNDDFIETNDNQIYSFKNKSNINLFLNDSIKQHKSIETGDTIKDGGILENEIYLIFKDTLIKNHLAEFLTGYNSIENWTLNKNRFYKKSILHEINYCNENDIGSYYNENLFLLNNKSKSKPSKQALKKNIEYNYYFYPFHQLFNETKSNELHGTDYNLITQIPIEHPAKEKLLKTYNKIENYYSETYIDYNNFIKSIIKNIRIGKLSIYNNGNNELIQKEEIDSLFFYSESRPQFDLYGEEIFDENYNQIYQKINYFYNYNDIVGIHFNEDWYLAKNQFDIIKKVNSISFLVKNYNELGNLLPEPKLLPFKIKFK